jgi:hypothetical protein
MTVMILSIAWIVALFHFFPHPSLSLHSYDSFFS